MCGSAHSSLSTPFFPHSEPEAPADRPTPLPVNNNQLRLQPRTQMRRKSMRSFLPWLMHLSPFVSVPTIVGGSAMVFWHNLKTPTLISDVPSPPQGDPPLFACQ